VRPERAGVAGPGRDGPGGRGVMPEEILAALVALCGFFVWAVALLLVAS
jgi:hypothetical protein